MIQQLAPNEEQWSEHSHSHSSLLTLSRYIVLENGLRALLISDFNGPAAPEDEDSEEEDEEEEEEEEDGDETEDESEEDGDQRGDEEDEEGKKKRGNAEKQVMQSFFFLLWLVASKLNITWVMMIK